MEILIQIAIICCLWIGISKKTRKKDVKRNGTGFSHPPAGNSSWKKVESINKRGYQSVMEQDAAAKAKQEELKRRLMEKYASRPFEPKEGRTDTIAASDILGRASANVAEDFEEEPLQWNTNIPAEAAGYRGQEDAVILEVRAEDIVKAADNLAEIDFSQIYDIPDIQRDSELMECVSNIMAKGIDTELTFQRDFIAEGTALMDRITT